jgi:hypothetical protein
VVSKNVWEPEFGVNHARHETIQNGSQKGTRDQFHFVNQSNFERRGILTTCPTQSAYSKSIGSPFQKPLIKLPLPGEVRPRIHPTVKKQTELIENALGNW